ncbi:MAG TPA: hypothetical protein VF038_08190 [Usitatibacter sp.]
MLEPRTKPGHTASAAFRCGLCGTYWTRNYVGDGLFLWSPEVREDPLEGR